jgi:hypothetical protein
MNTELSISEAFNWMRSKLGITTNLAHGNPTYRIEVYAMCRSTDLLPQLSSKADHD